MTKPIEGSTHRRVRRLREPHEFFTRDGLNVAELARAVQGALHIKKGHDGRLFAYKGGVYSAAGEDFARALTRDLLGDEFKRTHASEVIAWLKCDFPSIDPSVPPDTSGLNIANGLLHWPSGELRPHTPDHLSTVQVPVRWAPGARCPAIEKFLSEALPADAVEFALEVIGYALLAENPLHRAVLLLGPSRTGKSTLLRVIAALLGSDNVSSVPLQSFGTNRFASAALHGKLANIYADLDDAPLVSTSIFKVITGGDRVHAEHKFGEIFSFRATALPIFSANAIPHADDAGGAYSARWLTLPMERRPEVLDPDLGAKLTQPSELEGLLVRAVAGLQRVMRRGHFELPPSVRAATERHATQVNSVRAFLADRCVVSERAWARGSELVRAYEVWCRDERRKPVGRSELYGQVERLHRPAARNGYDGFVGLGLRAEREESRA